MLLSLPNSVNRSSLAKKNTLIMFFLKGAIILCNFLLVPITIKYIDTQNYGLWITIVSLVEWISYFDIGINNGLRNKLTESLANNDITLAQKYVSTAYFLLVLIFIPLMLLFLVINKYIDWAVFFNIKGSINNSLNIVIAIVFSFFCLKFILSTINIVLIAHQRPAEASFRQLCESILALICVFILTKTTKGSLVLLSLSMCLSSIVILSIFNFTLFNKRYKTIAPRLSSISIKILPSLLKMGVKFFIIQISWLIVFQTSNIIIQRYYGGDSVTYYDLTFKYFSVLSMIMSIIVTPIWSASTDAYTKGDYTWIKIIVKKLNIIFLFLLLFGLVMYAIYPFVFKLWVGSSVANNISKSLSISMLIFVLFKSYGMIYCYILNGIGALSIQFYWCIVSPFIFLILCYLFIAILKFDICSIPIAITIADSGAFILGPIQFRMIFYRNKTKKWIS